MYTAELCKNFLSIDERALFREFLDQHKLDENIWDVFESLFEAGTGRTRPLLLRISDPDGLQGACILVRTTKSGRSLFSKRLLAWMIDLYRIPSYLWIRFGCCMDMMSNTGFVRDPERFDEITHEMIRFLNGNTLLSIITDYTHNAGFYPMGRELPALPHALIDVSGMDSIESYTREYKNIRKKLKVFSKKGGNYSLVESKLEDPQLESLQSCFIATSRKSVFYLPYQDLYLNSALHVSRKNHNNVYYFLAVIEGEFLGYQAAIKTGKHLNALHGAFDRRRRTTHHAYDILFVKMTEFALENGLEQIDFGAVLNHTKQRMVNKTIEMSYFLLSRYKLVGWIFRQLLRFTRIQGKDQLLFRGGSPQ